jgi:hypothetical protein
VFNALHDSVVLQQIAAARRRSTLLDGFQEVNIVLQHAIDSFLYNLSRLLARA